MKELKLHRKKTAILTAASLPFSDSGSLIRGVYFK